MVKSRSVVQSQVTLTQVVRLSRADRDYAALLLANTALSDEGMGSLLFRELRTHDGFVYSVDSNLDVDENSVTFTISYACNPKDVDRAQAAAVAVIKQIQTQPLSTADMQRAKALLIARRVLPMESYRGVAVELLNERQLGGATTGQSSKFWSTLSATTPQQLQAAARRWLRPEHFLRVIVAPQN